MSNRTPLERAMNERRLQIKKQWKEVTRDAGGLSPETLRRVRLHGTDAVDDLTIAKLEVGLQLPRGGLREMERAANAPTPTDGTQAGWDHTLEAPAEPLTGNEILRWRPEGLGLRYRLDDGDHSVEAGFGLEETPGEVIDDLRDLLEQHRTWVRQMERRRARR